jgi:hypothetical protein
MALATATLSRSVSAARNLINSSVDVRAQFAFNDLAAHLSTGAADIRTLSVGAAYHM